MKLIYLFYFSLIFISCSNANNENLLNPEIVQIDISKSFTNTRKMLLSEISDSIFYIKLQTDSNTIFGRLRNLAENIQFTDSLIFINDGDQLFIFDFKGNFLNKISKKGNGPSEYLKIDNFFVDKFNKLIIVKSDAQQRLLFYNYQNQYVKSVNINNWPSHISILNTQYLILANEKGRRNFTNYYTYSIYDYSGKFLTYLSKNSWEQEIEKKEKIGLSDIANFYTFKDSLSYWELHYDTIWRIIDKNRIIPRFHINIGDLKMPDKFLLLSSSNEINRRIEFVRLWGLIESNKYFFFDLSYKKYLKHVFYDKTTKQSYNITHGEKKQEFSFINDIDGGMPFWPEGRCDSEKVFMFIYGYELNSKMGKDFRLKYRSSKNSTLYDLVSNANILDNPILMIVKLKN